MKERIRVAAVQMRAALGDVEQNLRSAERIVRQAVQSGADWVILPEFFPSAVAFHPKMLRAARSLEGGGPRDLLRSLARGAQPGRGRLFHRPRRDPDRGCGRPDPGPDAGRGRGGLCDRGSQALQENAAGGPDPAEVLDTPLAATVPACVGTSEPARQDILQPQDPELPIAPEA